MKQVNSFLTWQCKVYVVGRAEINVHLKISNLLCALIFVSELILHKGVYVFSFNNEFTGNLQRNISADSAGKYINNINQTVCLHSSLSDI